jgi:hypothetical protein
MKSTMNFARFGASVLVLSTATLLRATDPNPVQSSSLTVHEWGTFTSVAGTDGSAVEWDTLSCSDDLPRFVNAEGYRGFKFGLQGTVRMETPVMYFYSPREVVVRVTVQFPFGVITEWYPSGDNAIYESKSLMDRVGASLKTRLYSDDAVYQTKDLVDPPPSGLDPLLVRLSKSLNGIDTSLRQLMGAIGWNDVKVQPDSPADFPVENRPSRYYAARQTDATPISVGGQREKFLFYRGVGRFQVPLSARVSSDGKVAVENRGSDPVPSVILFENRGGHPGYRNAGTLKDAVTLDRPSLDSSFVQLLYDLESILVAQGLFPREAEAMLETWRDSWFEEGSRLIYIVPARAINTILPLRVEPAASQTARVFVGRIELVTPETQRLVKEALAHGDWSAIDGYGRFLGPILERVSSEQPLTASQIEQFRRHVQGSPNTVVCRP